MLANMLSNTLGQLLGELLGETLEQKLDRRAMLRALTAAITRAEQRLAQEYRAQDAELVDALTAQTRFADLPSVRAALRDMLTRPFHDPAQPLTTLRQSFADVLPERLDRARVDATVQAFLGYLGQEVLYIPQLRELYALMFQKHTAEQIAALVQGIQALRDDRLLLTATPPPLALPQPTPAPAERPRPWHNLPQRSYTRFVGRQAELEKLTQLLLPHPRSRHFVVTLDGIGGVGKSALALELAYRYRDGYAALPPDERFDAIIWVSAKRTLLTASGIQQRQQTFNTLNDLYREITTVLEQPLILQTGAEQRRGLIERALSSQRTLLIVDNLETVDDEELLSFLRELPDPTKVIVTTRHRIDIAYTIRLSGMPAPDAHALMLVEAARKGVELPVAATEDLYRRSGGIPLAIVWSIGLMSLGHSVESVLRRLGSGHSDIARFCFAESVARIRDRAAYRLLLALALFERSVNRQMLGDVAGLGDDVIGRDDGLAELLQLSLVEQKADRFKLLPLTQSYALEELAARPALEKELRERWIDYFITFAQPYRVVHSLQPGPLQLLREGAHLVNLARWSQHELRPDVFLSILPPLLSYTDTIGDWTELLAISQLGLEFATLTGRIQEIPRIQNALSWVHSQQGRHKQAEDALTNGLIIARQLNDVIWQIEILGHYSQAVRRQGALKKAEEYANQAFNLLGALPERQAQYIRADIEDEMGKIARDSGDWATAEHYFHTARNIYSVDEDDPPFNIERAWGLLGNIGYIAHQRGELEEANKYYLQCLTFFRSLGGKGYLTTLLVRLAALEEQRGNLATALDYAREALESSSKLGMVQEQALAEALLAKIEA
jgi:LuxR family glucitol operon transcriptional activator